LSARHWRLTASSGLCHNFNSQGLCRTIVFSWSAPIPAVMTADISGSLLPTRYGIRPCRYG